MHIFMCMGTDIDKRIKAINIWLTTTETGLELNYNQN